MRNQLEAKIEIYKEREKKVRDILASALGEYLSEDIVHLSYMAKMQIVTDAAVMERLGEVAQQILDLNVTKG